MKRPPAGLRHNEIQVCTPIEFGETIPTDHGPYTPTEQDVADLNEGASITSLLDSGVEVNIYPCSERDV